MHSDIPAADHAPLRRSGLVFLAAVITFLAGSAPAAFAEGEISPSEATATAKPASVEQAAAPADATPGSDSSSEKERRNERRQQAISVATLLLGMIAVVGVVMMALTVVWGSRMRAKLRNTTEKGGRPDDLWYLRDRARPASVTPPSPPKSE